MIEILKYKSETDKGLGIAGMAISLLAADALDMLAKVSMVEGEEPVTMAEEFFFSGNPRMSAKFAWYEGLRQYDITASMILANVLCRSLCSSTGVINNESLKAVHDHLVEQGQELCSLDADEVETLYSRSYRKHHSIFSHPTVGTVARDFANTLRMLQHMTGAEVADNLRRLNFG